MTDSVPICSEIAFESAFRPEDLRKMANLVRLNGRKRPVCFFWASILFPTHCF